jgi:hypothetical protein
MEAFRINGERLWQSLMEMARIGATPRGGVCRVALTDVCKDGISHNEIEDATPEDVAAGCNVLLQAILEKAAE